MGGGTSVRMEESREGDDFGEASGRSKDEWMLGRREK